jgi:uncharacterized membrane protein YgdD (TMEM256/DUF423 family)
MTMSTRWILALAALNGLLGVAMGAQGAHNALYQHTQDLVRTGSLYQLLHATAAVAVLRFSRWSAFVMSVGGFLFGCSLYLMALPLHGEPRTLGMIGISVLGMMTPAGGMLMLAGWFVLLVTALRSGATAQPERS